MIVHVAIIATRRYLLKAHLVKLLAEREQSDACELREQMRQGIKMLQEGQEAPREVLFTQKLEKKFFLRDLATEP